MDFVFEKMEKELGPSPTILDPKNTKRIKSEFPIPAEQRIAWANVDFTGRISGMVVTNKGFFIKADKETIKEYNSNVKNKKDKTNVLYHYIKWENFDINDFEVKYATGNPGIYFNNSKILSCKAWDCSHNFFKLYDDTYKSIISESTTTTSTVFSDVEAIIPENWAAVNTKTGHGEMAEEALTLLDKMEGKDAEVVGRTNEKNGADRLVNGIEIQTKYYSSGKKCIDACFDKEGFFRYKTSQGNPMQIEVPKDKYAEAVNTFREKIIEGKIPGVTDPNDATKYVKQGKLTYNQAKNLCKPGITSLVYDSITGAIYCSCAGGISFFATFLLCYIQTGDRKASFNAAIEAGIHVFGLSFMAHILTQQVARTTLTRNLIPLSTYIVKKMGYKTTQAIVNSLRLMVGKSSISGAAATKQLAKIFRSNIVTSIVTIIAFSVPDTYKFFAKKSSGAQYTKNMLSLIATTVAAGGGTLGASVAAAKIAGIIGTSIAPGVGTAIGVAGGLVGGLVGGTVVKIAGDSIREDDSVIISRMYNSIVINLIIEYMLSEKEVDQLIEAFNKITPKEYKNLFASVQSSPNQEKVIIEYIRHFFDEIVAQRPQIDEPTPEDYVNFAKQFEETAG